MSDVTPLAALISAGLIVSGLIILYLQHRVSDRLQHPFAFLVISILILSILPRAIHAPEVLFSFGMILFALHLSTYYSGTPQNSGRLYGLILLFTGIVPVLHAFPSFYHHAVLRYVVGLLIWLLLFRLESQVSRVDQPGTRMEQTLLWVWFVSALMTLVQPELSTLPDMIFVLLLLVHIEHAWGRRHIPAPIVILYALLLGWNLHFIYGLAYLGIPQGVLEPMEEMWLSILALSLMLWRIIRTKSLTKRFMYFWLFQEVVLLHFELSNWFLSVSHFYDVIRFLLFSALTGLFVMIESRARNPLDRGLLQGLGYERRRLTVFMLSIIALLALYPMAYWWRTGQHLIPMLSLFILGAVLLADQVRISFTRVERAYRIIRPSLSIWSTVILTLIWGTLILFNTLTTQ